MSHIGQILAKANLFCSPFCRLFASIQKKLYNIVTALSLWEAGKFFVTQSVEIATPAFGGLAMTAREIVIARSIATKQSLFFI